MKDDVPSLCLGHLCLGSFLILLVCKEWRGGSRAKVVQATGVEIVFHVGLQVHTLNAPLVCTGFGMACLHASDFWSVGGFDVRGTQRHKQPLPLSAHLPCVAVAGATLDPALFRPETPLCPGTNNFTFKMPQVGSFE